MGTLVPEDFDLRGLRNDTERRVVAAFRDGLSDRWLILPDVAITGSRDRQCDVVLVNPDHGVLDVEVKGHRMVIRDGVWLGPDHPVNPQPFDQAQGNAYALRELLRDRDIYLRRIEVEYAIALPNTLAITGDLPTGIDRTQVLTDASLDDPAEAITQVMRYRRDARIGDDAVARIVRILRPDVDFTWDPNAGLRAARNRLDEVCSQQLRPIESLDDNRRVLAVGAAGTGKTRLAMAWARRAAVHRDERVLLTCYNEPLADDMRARLGDFDGVHVAPVLRFILDLEGLPPLAIPENAGQDWWDTRPVGHATKHWDHVTQRFDTIVVDEAQDFSPAWLGLLESLLDPDGPRRMLMVADPAQELYPRGFRLPSPTDGWTVVTLATNCRNTRSIGSLLRRHLNGAAAPAVGPESLGVTWCGAETADESVAEAVAQVERLLHDEGRRVEDLLVLTGGSGVRDQLLAEKGFARWDDAGGRVVCETVRRMKGLEADTVVLVLDPDHATDDLLYVGIGRAVSELVLIAPRTVAQQLRLAPPAP